MAWAGFGMEHDVAHSGEQIDGLLSVAAFHARDLQASCVDVSAMIFPTAAQPPSEATIAAVSAKLAALVSSIETRLTGQKSDSPSAAIWQLMARSGFLREPELVECMLARIAADRLEARIDAQGDFSPVQQLPAMLLDHDDARVADAAQNLLAADSLHRRSTGFAYQELRPELLHQMVWRTVAAMEVARGGKSPAEMDAAKRMLAEHDESRTVQNAAARLVHFLGGDTSYALLDPGKAGLHLFIAAIASRIEIDADHVLRLFDASSAAPGALMLRACGVEKEAALAIIYLFRGFQLTPRDVQLFERDYDAIPVEMTRGEIQSWALMRAQFLLSGERL